MAKSEQDYGATSLRSQDDYVTQSTSIVTPMTLFSEGMMRLNSLSNESLEAKKPATSVRS